MNELTGNSRYRISFNYKLVLQVEYTRRYGVLNVKEEKLWRDAKISDLRLLIREPELKPTKLRSVK